MKKYDNHYTHICALPIRDHSRDMCQSRTCAPRLNVYAQSSKRQKVVDEEKEVVEKMWKIKDKLKKKYNAAELKAILKYVIIGVSLKRERVG